MERREALSGARSYLAVKQTVLSAEWEPCEFGCSRMGNSSSILQNRDRHGPTCVLPARLLAQDSLHVSSVSPNSWRDLPDPSTTQASVPQGSLPCSVSS